MTSKADEPVWTTKDIVDNASKWSLAGDAALLRHLETFSEELFAKAARTNDDLNGLLDDLDAATIRLDLVKNEFLGLQNTQFIESRVYEDDETVQKTVVEKDEVKDADKEAMQNAIRDSVLEGLKVLDQFYERVSLPGSDSEGEETDSFVLRPKDPYLVRPLPYVIGTDEWNSTWHVGLEMSDSEEEEEVEERYSDDEGSDVDLPVTDRRVLTTDSLESRDVPVASSTMNDSRVSTDDDEKPNSIPSKAPLSNASFAEQLAAKLGGVRSEREDDVEEEVNTRPIQPTVPRTHQIGGLLSNEPPPLDDVDDGLFNNTGMFSNGDGLFDDDASESFWGRISVKQTQPDKKQEQSSVQSGGAGVTKKNDRDMFDDDEDDDAIFSTASVSKPPKSSSILKGYSNTISFVDDEPPELFVETNDKKPKPGSSANAESSTPSPRSDDRLLINAKQERKGAPGLFDDFVDPFKDDLFAGAGGGGLFSATPPKLPGLFDDAAPPLRPLDDDGLDEPQKSRGLFDDDDEDGELFATANEGVPKRSTLFDSEPPPLDESLFGDSSKSLFDKDLLFDEGSKSGPSKNVDSLFEDDDVAGKSSLFDVPPPLDVAADKGNSLFDDEDENAPSEVEKSKDEDKVNSLFDDDEDVNVPPPLEVEKSRSNSLFDEDSSDDDIFGGGRQKPPPLPKPAARTKPVPAKRDVPAEDKSKSKTGSSPGKLKHNLNINVNALLPGAAFPKRRDSSSSLNKSQSLEETSDVDRSTGKLSHAQSQEDNREKAPLDDDDGDGHIRPLFSITKNRARVQTKRRPSTRRGRKEHLQKAQEETLNNNVPSQDLDAPLDNRVEQDPNINGNYLTNPEGTGNVISRNSDLIKDVSRVQTEDFASDIGRVRNEDIFKDIESNVSQTQDIFENVDSEGSRAQAEDIFKDADSNVSKVRAEDIFKDVDSRGSEVLAEDIFKNTETNVSKSQTKDIFEDVEPKGSGVRTEDIFKNAEPDESKGVSSGFKDGNSSKGKTKDIFKDVESQGSQVEDIFKNVDSNPRKVEGENKNFKKDLDDGLFTGSEDLFAKPPKSVSFDQFKHDLFADVVQVKKEVVDPDDLFAPASSKNLFSPPNSENLFAPVKTENLFLPKSESPIDIFEEAASTFVAKPPQIDTKKPVKVTGDGLFDDGDDGIFQSVKPVKSKTGGGLFDDMDDSEDLFGGKKSGYFAEKKKTVTAQKKKDSLFDDVDEDDDIFGSGTKFAPSKVLPVAEKKSKARSLLKRAEETAVDYDPLDALGPKE